MPSGDCTPLSSDDITSSGRDSLRWNTSARDTQISFGQLGKERVYVCLFLPPS